MFFSTSPAEVQAVVNNEHIHYVPTSRLGSIPLPGCRSLFLCILVYMQTANPDKGLASKSGILGRLVLVIADELESR